MGTKDLFSGHSPIYAAFRPTYPRELYEFILRHLRHQDRAWDCGTGNGQVAQYLALHFKEVYATDISQHQIDNAVNKQNIFYSVSKAEETLFEDHKFDLTTVGQALHWFERQRFYNEVHRTSKPGALLAAWGYANLKVSPFIDKKFNYFYTDVVGPYWDEARKLVENEYRDIEFPFKKIPSPKFAIRVEWSLEQFAGYLTSWSATQKFIKVKEYNPVNEFIATLAEAWKPGEIKPVTFPVFLKLGLII